MQKGAASPLIQNSRRFKKQGSTVLPMQDLGVESTADKRLRSIDVGLGNGFNNPLALGVTTGSAAMQAATDDMWHRHMGHINRRSMDIRRKVMGNGVEYRGKMKACGTCHLWKNAQQDHPNRQRTATLC